MPREAILDVAQRALKGDLSVDVELQMPDESTRRRFATHITEIDDSRLPVRLETGFAPDECEDDWHWARIYDDGYGWGVVSLAISAQQSPAEPAKPACMSREAILVPEPAPKPWTKVKLVGTTPEPEDARAPGTVSGASCVQGFGFYPVPAAEPMNFQRLMRLIVQAPDPEDHAAFVAYMSFLTHLLPAGCLTLD
jgi:hypothetical protein